MPKFTSAIIVGFSLVASLGALPLSAQTPPEQPGNLYVLALRAAAEVQAKSYRYQGDRDYYDLVVEKDKTTQEIPEQVGPFRVSVLDSYGLRDRFRKQGKFPVLEILPAQIKGPLLSVSIQTCWFSYREPRLFRHARFEFAVEGGAVVEFRYDCERRQFVVNGVNLWGV
jgi:hypothetical protein